MKKNIRIVFIFFLCVHLSYLCFLGTKKINFHIDEYFTYALANKEDATMPMWPRWEEEKEYTGEEFFIQEHAPSKEECFDYRKVWENQKNDVHPPLYYVLVHTVCSFFPGVFSKWEGLAVNFLLLLVMDWLVYAVMKKVTGNEWIALLASVIHGFSFISLNMALYIRMYALMTAFALALLLLFITYYDKKRDRKFYLGLFFLAVGGTMTQYYFLIYLFFTCLTFGIMLLLKKEWKDAGKYIAVLTAAGVACVALFPAMLTQIFGGSDRGQEAFQNASNLNGVIEKLKDFFYIINREVFGNAIFLFVGIAVVCVILGKIRHWNLWRQGGALVMFLPSAILYSCVVAVIAPYREDRYIMCAAPILLLTAVWVVYMLFVHLFQKHQMRNAGILLLGVFLLVFGHNMVQMKGMPTYTYQFMKEKQGKLAEYVDYPVVYVYDNSWTVNDNVVELKKFKSYTFVRAENLERYLSEVEDEKMVLYNETRNDSEELIQSVMQEKPELQMKGKIFQNSAEAVFVFEKE